jgi:hypothetical protein
VCPAGSAAIGACAAGTYSQSGVCLSCVAGSYCPSNVNAPTPCTKGTYTARKNAVQQADCTDAAPGSYVSTPGAVEPTACIPGTFQDQSAQTSCKTCPAGGYCPSGSLASFTNCPAGSVSSEGAAACTPVASGYYARSGDSLQSVCPSGSACPGGVLTPCAPGTYSPNQYATACTPAPAGSYVDVLSAQSYTLCPATTYNPVVGASTSAACLPCGPGYACPKGSVERNNNPSCAQGTYVSGGTCAACPAGAFCPAGALIPTSCAAGTFSAAANAAACTAASAGSFVGSSGQSTQSQCPIGTYSPSTGASACAACAAGTYDNVALGRTSPCGACPANSYCPTATSQLSCPANTVSPAGSATALRCQCNNGYACNYTKRIAATVTLNISLSDWNNNTNGVKTAFIAAIAAGAGVPIGQISITNAKAKVVAPVVNGGGLRRMLSVGSSTRLRSTRELRDAARSQQRSERTRVSFEVHGVDRRHDVRRGLERVLAGVF